MLVAAFCF
jgi:hypothetical protein